MHANARFYQIMNEPAPPETQTQPASSDDLMVRLRAALERHARAGHCIAYRDLAAEVAWPPPHRIHGLTLALETLVRADHAAGRPLLAALAVGRANAGIPGRGFFQLLADLGHYGGPDQGPEAAACHGREVAAVFASRGAGTAKD